MAKTEKVEISRGRGARGAPERHFVPATDVYETSEELVLVADVPGVGPEGVDVTVEDNVLVIRGRPTPRTEERGRLLVQEFETGEYYRAFQLPADYDTDRMAATLKQGVLTLRLPKSARLKPRRIEVKEV